MKIKITEHLERLPDTLLSRAEGLWDSYAYLGDLRHDEDHITILDLMAWYYGNDEQFFNFLNMNEELQSKEVNEAEKEYQDALSTKYEMLNNRI